MKTSSLVLAILMVLSGAAATAQPSQSVTTTVTTTSGPPPTSSAREAFRVAKDGVDPALRSRVVSIYGLGSPAAIHIWYVIFYDPSAASHGRAVRVEDGQITRTYAAKGGVVYDDTLTFDPTQIRNEGPALGAAQNYAAQHALAYDHVRVLLRMTTREPALRWRVQMLDGHTSRGFVFVNAADGSFAMYAPPGSQPATGGVAGDVQHAANDVKNTFLGIGGDLQEFFTGERTVDQ